MKYDFEEQKVCQLKTIYFNVKMVTSDTFDVNVFRFLAKERQ